jgi:hypothetical protein
MKSFRFDIISAFRKTVSPFATFFLFLQPGINTHFFQFLTIAKKSRILSDEELKITTRIFLTKHADILFLFSGAFPDLTFWISATPSPASQIIFVRPSQFTEVFPEIIEFRRLVWAEILVTLPFHCVIECFRLSRNPGEINTMLAIQSAVGDIFQIRHYFRLPTLILEGFQQYGQHKASVILNKMIESNHGYMGFREFSRFFPKMMLASALFNWLPGSDYPF